MMAGRFSSERDLVAAAARRHGVTVERLHRSLIPAEVSAVADEIAALDESPFARAFRAEMAVA
jgi:hypothetical protein